MSHLKLFLFGPPRLERDGQTINTGRRKVLALLVYLAVTGQSHSRDTLATLFWPDSDQSTGRANLRRTLYRLNGLLDEEILTTTAETITLDPTAGLWLDVAAFQELIDGGRPAEAAELYTGDFLAGFTLSDCPDFDEWQFFQGETLRRSLAGVLAELAQIQAGPGDWEPAITAARRWLALDPLHEPAHRCLIELYARSGQQAAALRQYGECARLLQEELGVKPEAETTALAEAVRARRFPPAGENKAGFHPGKAESQDFALPQSLPGGGKTGPEPPRSSLPAPATPLLGREKELAEVAGLLAGPDCRLLTLIGPGGIGKTRLSIEAAHQANFPGGAWFIPLAPLSSAASLVSVVADRLGLNFHGAGAPRRQLFSYLRGRSLLLVLDNFEHLLGSGEAEDGAALVAELLSAAPEVKLLVTSRERLNIGAEWVLTIDGLALPPGSGADEIERYSAVGLFLERARHFRRDFGQGAEERACAVRICRLVGGIPLAIELAAAWVNVLSCREIVEEVEQNLDFLATSARDVPERHRNMRVVFDASWSILSEDERRLFRRLSVFRGGLTRAAAEAVSGEINWTGESLRLADNGELWAETRQGAVLQALAGLADKSFLLYTPEERYEVHELMRQYGAEKLAARPDEEQQVRDRHSRYYLALLARLEGRIKGRDQRQARQQVAAEFENIKIAWQRAAEQGRFEELLQASEALWLFFAEGNLFRESVSMLGDTLAVLEELPPGHPGQELARGVLLAIKAASLMRGGSYMAATTTLNRAVALLSPLAAHRWLGLVLNWKASTYILLGSYAEARDCLVESIALSRQAGDRWLTAYSLNDLGLVTHVLGDTGQAQELSQQSLAIFVDYDDRRGLAFALNNLGYFAYCLADYAEADWFYHESLNLRRQNGDGWGVANGLIRLGQVAGARGDRLGAQTHLRAAIRTALDIRAMPEVLEALVELAARLDEAGEREMARVVLDACLHHPALSRQTREKAGGLLARLLGLAAPPPALPLTEAEAEEALNGVIKMIVSIEERVKGD